MYRSLTFTNFKQYNNNSMMAFVLMYHLTFPYYVHLLLQCFIKLNQLNSRSSAYFV